MVKKPTVLDIGQKTRKDADDLYKCFLKLIKHTYPESKWKFTYTVSLSAEPTIEKTREIKV